MSTVSVAMNRWGNLQCYVGARWVAEFGQTYDAMLWLSGQIDAGHTISPKSYVTAAEVKAHRDGLATPTYRQLKACAKDVAALFRTYDRFDWWVDRLHSMEFICDQQNFHMHEAFARAADGATFDLGLPPCIL